MSKRFALHVALAASVAIGLATSAFAQDTIKIGELNSYKSQPAFLDPYKKGWEMAVEEINAKGGVLGKKLEVVSRDDGANPGDAVRVAEELLSRDGLSRLGAVMAVDGDGVLRGIVTVEAVQRALRSAAPA